MDEIVVTLLETVNTSDSMKRQKTEVISQSDVFGTKKAIRADEFFKAGQAGFRPQFQIDVHTCEYNGERLAEIGGKRYAVYRTYPRSDGFTELYLEERTGV